MATKSFSIRIDETMLDKLHVLADYEGRSAPLRRNRQIVDYADLVLLFWDGSSHGTRHVLNLCRSLSKPHRLFSPAKLGQVKSE